MANPTLDPAKIPVVRKLKAEHPEWSHVRIGKVAGVSEGIVRRILRKALGSMEGADLQAAVKRYLTKQPMSELELADALDSQPSKIREAIRGMQDSGTNLRLVHGDRYLLNNIVEHGGAPIS